MTDLGQDLRKYFGLIALLIPLPVAVLELESLYTLANIAAFIALLTFGSALISPILNYRKFYRAYQQTKAKTGSRLAAFQIMSFMPPYFIGLILFAILMPMSMINNSGGTFILGATGIAFLALGGVLMFKGMTNTESDASGGRRSQQ